MNCKVTFRSIHTACNEMLRLSGLTFCYKVFNSLKNCCLCESHIGIRGITGIFPIFTRPSPRWGKLSSSSPDRFTAMKRAQILPTKFRMEVLEMRKFPLPLPGIKPLFLGRPKPQPSHWSNYAICALTSRSF
jgi:hypothetical protein